MGIVVYQTEENSKLPKRFKVECQGRDTKYPREWYLDSNPDKQTYDTYEEALKYAKYRESTGIYRARIIDTQIKPKDTPKPAEEDKPKVTSKPAEEDEPLTLRNFIPRLFRGWSVNSD